jgi:exopolysaccharide biosynthesis polyprenyl glycosylphosphotransferase
MAYSKHWFIFRANVIADLGALFLAVLLAAAISGQYLLGFSLTEILAMRFSLANIVGAVFLTVLWLLIFQQLGLYRPRRLRIGLIGEIVSVARATAVGTVVIAALGLFFNIRLFSPLFHAVFWPSVTLLDLLFRQLLLRSLRQLNLGDKNMRNVLIVGTNESATNYAHIIEANADVGYQLLGFIDDQVLGSDSRVKYLGKLEDFPALLDRMVVDEVVIAMPIHAFSKAIQEIIDHAHERGIAVRFPQSQVFSGLSRNNIWRVRQEAMLGPTGQTAMDLVVYSGHQVGYRYLLKRLFDLAFSSFLIAIASPLMLLAALLIAVTSGRPVLFVQDRYGYNGRVFKLYKFRTMVKNADAMQAALRDKSERGGAAFKIKRDPRITPVGRWLRKTSIDELPQLFNVIKGEMSMVGPRPLPLADYARIENIGHRRRLSVLPGITGPWQVSGRDNISFEEWMRMDLEYIDNWRLSTDLKILFSTIPVVLFGKGAS